MKRRERPCCSAFNAECSRADQPELTRECIDAGQRFDKQLGNAAGQQPRLKFEVQNVIRASGGFSPCFLYDGCLITSESNQSESVAMSKPSFASQFRSVDDIEAAPTITPTNEKLTLYISYEESSPKFKKTSPRQSPYRMSLRDRHDEMLFCSRGLDAELYADTNLLTIIWGSSLSITFPDLASFTDFKTYIRRITIIDCDLTVRNDSTMEAPLWLSSDVSSRSLRGVPDVEDDVKTTGTSIGAPVCPPGDLFLALMA